MNENSIGTLLYHVAIVEMDWLFVDLRGREFPQPVATFFPFPFCTGKRLTLVRSVPLEEHIDRLDRSRPFFLDDLASMTLDDWRRARTSVSPDRTVTPEWVVFHLVEHEAWHADQMRYLKSLAGEAPGR